jgi:PAS domain S-box-containing protein
MSSSTLTFDEYRALAEASPVMIWRAGTDTTCNYVNETWLAFTGRTQEQEAGTGWTEGVHPEDLDRCMAVYLESFAARRAFEVEYRLRRHDGVYRWIFDRGVPFQVNGELAGYIGSCIDVHERKEAEANRRLTLSMVAHELRTPLTSLQIYLDVIEKRGGSVLGPAMFQKVSLQVQQFSKLIDDLSDTARIESKQQLSMSKQPIDLGEVIHRVASTYQELLPRRSIPVRLEASIEPGPFPIVGDPDRLEQVVINIVENACKFSLADGLVTLRLSHTADTNRVEVIDRGVGIAAAELPFVTRPYYRASNAASNRYPGAGMGLAIVNEIVAQHGGTLEIASELGRGTAVTITLPRSP